MLHTFIGAAGKRLVIRQSPTKAGAVLIQILSADREVQASLTIDAACCAVAGDVFTREADAAWAAADAESDRAKAMIGAGVDHG